MAKNRLTKTRLTDGVWDGILTLAKEFDAPPPLKAMHLDRVLDGLDVQAEGEGGRFRVRLPIPTELLSDGLQTILLIDQDSGETLNSIAILAGDALAEDMRAEMDLLRAELDMLKRAFRRHCVETM
ncbi:hypothetical protein [Aestuariibius sp. HNIBRBA575]|uniref:hypothetical protein n=1 Tax=Aestuariibius sp. HNIBRBA575 TaxID=3233343 RepID=UPI0034A484D7